MAFFSKNQHSIKPFNDLILIIFDENKTSQTDEMYNPVIFIHFRCLIACLQ